MLSLDSSYFILLVSLDSSYFILLVSLLPVLIVKYFLSLGPKLLFKTLLFLTELLCEPILHFFSKQLLFLIMSSS